MNETASILLLLILAVWLFNTDRFQAFLEVVKTA